MSEHRERRIRHEPVQCVCTVHVSAPAWHGKRRGGTLSTRSGAAHMNPECPHGTLYIEQRVYPARLRMRSEKAARAKARADAKGYRAASVPRREKIA